MTLDPVADRELLAGIRILLLDVDGILTGGELRFDGEGRELKVFHVHDGAGLVYWHRTGHLSAFISGRDSKTTRDRGQELGVAEIHLGTGGKAEVYRDILARHGLTDRQACYMGDDLLDLPVLRLCGLPITVPNARAEVKEVSRHVTAIRGGRGAVREVIELLLKAKGLWDRIVQGGGRCA